MALKRRKLRGRGKSIRLDKGDTLGGTASLLLLDQIGGGTGGGGTIGRRRSSPVGRAMRGLATWSVILLTAAALVVLGWDWLEDGVKAVSAFL